MHKENLASTNSCFVAQAKSQSATAETKKAWRKASRKGQYAVGIVASKLVCIFMMLLYVYSANCKIYDKFCMQQVGIHSDRNAARKCQRWQFSWQTAHQVSSIACHKCKIPKKAFPRINTCKLQCKEIAQKGKDELETNFGFVESQKSSPVSDRIRVKM